MRVLKIEAEGITTSFRYPHFVLQVQPTYEMPPPATIYGHIASALGGWFNPQGIRFAYHFTHTAQFNDMEHIVLLSPGSGNLPGTQLPRLMEGKINPFDRHILFQPRLTLYLNRPEWEEAFRNPAYLVVLGRSQDLFTYTRIQVVTLERAAEAYFEHTLLPYNANRYTTRGYALLMPRYLDNFKRRQPDFARYFILKDRLHTRKDDFLWSGLASPPHFWVDPTSPRIDGTYRGVPWLSFVGGEDESFFA